MAFYRNNSQIGFNGALPGRTIETDDPAYIAVLLERGFVEVTETTETTPETTETVEGKKKTKK